MNKQTILITGSEDKIGRYLFNDIKDRGYSLRVLHYDGAKKPENKI
jgi:nucleoside-diphosphate-sugar epimerase